MTAGKNTWLARFRWGAVRGLVVAVVLYPLIDTLALCIPRNAAEISMRDVVLWVLCWNFVVVGVITTVLAVFDWFAKFREFLALRRAQRNPMK